MPSELDLWNGESLESSGSILESGDCEGVTEIEEGGSRKIGRGDPKLWVIFEKRKIGMDIKKDFGTQTVN